MSETITGTCEAITEKGDWTTFEINVGSQYPIRLATKVPELIELGRAAKGQVMEWTFNAVEGKINEKSGKPYINRYFEGVEPANDAPVSVRSDDGSIRTENVGRHAPTSEGMTPEKWDAKERRDYRSRAWAQTLAAFQHTIKVEEDPEAVFSRLRPFQRKVYEDVTGEFAYPEDGSDLPFE